MNYVDIAERALLSGEQGRWKAALIASTQIGEYKHGFAQELASRMGYSDVSRISDLADAGRARRALKMPAREVLKFRLSVYTFCWRVLQAGAEPEAVREVLYDFIEEFDRPKMKDVTDALSATFGVPIREYTATSWLKTLDRLVSWGASKVDHVHREEWNRATSAIRKILKESETI